MKKILYTIAFLSVFGIQGRMAKADNVKIHAIVFCNTEDEKIGESCKNDQEQFVEELGNIETALGCEVDWLNVYTGEECSKTNLEKVVSGLQCGANDIIFFYYSGHGVHAKADPVDGWLPQMCLKYKSYDQDKFVPVTYVRDQIAPKPARLKIILTDCCNNEAEWVSVKGLIFSDGRAPNTSEMNIAKLKKLFYESRGTIIATSSKRGQTSGCYSRGGIFSMAFWDEIYRIEQGDGTPDWKSVLEATKRKTLQDTNNLQEPVYTIEINGTTNTSTGTTQPAPPTPVTQPSPVVIAVGEKELGEAFKKIVNPSNSRNERLKMVGGIVQRLFDTNAKVVIVGRNLKTIIGEPMNISKYLEELALSKTVKGINIVRTNKNSAGKYDYITISEIR